MTIAAGRRGRVAALVGVLVLALAGFLVLSEAYVDNWPIVDLDARVEEWVAGRMPTWAEWLARPFTWAGGTVGLAVVVGVTVAMLLWGGRRADAFLVVAAAVGSQFLVTLLKPMYGRARPDAGSPIDLPYSTSFPSGHAATGIALFGALAVIAAVRARSSREAAGLLVLGLLVGVAVGASRVVLNVHFVSDVLAGFCLGLAWLSVCLLVRELVAGRSV